MYAGEQHTKVRFSNTSRWSNNFPPTPGKPFIAATATVSKAPQSSCCGGVSAVEVGGGRIKIVEPCKRVWFVHGGKSLGRLQELASYRSTGALELLRCTTMLFRKIPFIPDATHQQAE